jgi:hypothetical protein
MIGYAFGTNYPLLITPPPGRERVHVQRHHPSIVNHSLLVKSDLLICIGAVPKTQYAFNTAPWQQRD